MADLQANMEKYETAAAECDMIARLATDKAKRALYERLAAHYREVIAELEKIITNRDAA